MSEIIKKLKEMGIPNTVVCTDCDKVDTVTENGGALVHTKEGIYYYCSICKYKKPKSIGIWKDC